MKKRFWFDLPPELIAQTPAEKRDVRLMRLDRKTGETAHYIFHDLPDLLSQGDCLVINDTRVLPARLLGRRTTGGAVELVLLRDLGGGRWECLSRPGKKTRPGAHLEFGDGALEAVVEDVLEGGNRLVRFEYEGIFLEVLERLGKMPLPPYITRELEDAERYQTVYSACPAPPPPRRAFISRKNFWIPSGRRGLSSRRLRCTSASGRSAPSRRKTSKTTSCTPSTAKSRKKRR